MKKSRIIGATWRIRLLPSSDGSDADAREFGNAQDLRRHRPIRERPLDPQSAYRCQSSADQIIDGPCLALRHSSTSNITIPLDMRRPRLRVAAS
ncbi:MAG: hypothetical protein JWQ50_1008 [Caballeronia mineralivorans]|jgi:hypothetical protein|nr:hypothetical protein [Caballeronia mineralivorans]